MFLLCSLTCCQIWLSPLVDDHQTTYLIKFGGGENTVPDVSFYVLIFSSVATYVQCKTSFLYGLQSGTFV
jgi:hypothetical protein